MLTFQEFFDICNGFWTIERTYHYLPSGEVERSHTEYQVDRLSALEKRRIVAMALPEGAISAAHEADCPGFTIAFDTVSETGERKAMSLKALFVLDDMMPHVKIPNTIPTPIAAEIPTTDPEIQRGYYLRDEGYSESGAIAGRFTYQPSRGTLEMTTVYSRSVSVDQMRIISPDTRLRTIVTYQRPIDQSPPSIITLTGFGLERKQS
ncbi:phycobiliprotein lyase [filamentous cyanobacterium LEGE 11480]|uniref:Chromophore lyase CpcS/CpeS n=1 Tax=Romeriopsis navalis LEGE 11480 TaxID=2777977 RepID=A0A928Z2U1_9CYAN|nr:phycobiliprotein lyase [Romeriopsis navalis]MBE9028488.1 phycobiliprotein lyase [Romeriopsis navalis LEGE 11480]